MNIVLKNFNPLESKKNLQRVLALGPGECLRTTARGELKKISKSAFLIVNFLTLGYLSYATQKAIYLSFVTFCLNLYLPLNKIVAKKYLQRKSLFLARLEGKIAGIFKNFPLEKLRYHRHVFERGAQLQLHIRDSIYRATRRCKESEVIGSIKRAFTVGARPELIIEGLSGSYWMKDSEGERVGLFKPFDEEVFAPNNPIGATHQGVLGERKMRPGIRVGESAHREVAAYRVDQFFGFGIVPSTCYANFCHESFFDASAKKETSRREKKEKWGSFQERVEGFTPLYNYEEVEKISLVEFQLLVTLDIILGNSDRNLANILVYKGKIAAIDHGLCFSDLPEDLSVDYWELMPQGQRALTDALKQLWDNFPLPALKERLRKYYIPPEALSRMGERVALAKAAFDAHLTPAQMVPLFTTAYLERLMDFSETLPERARACVVEFLSDFEPAKISLPR